jgi:hypothetical protein
LDFRFNLASKGGGTTVVLLQLGLDDFKRILENVADVMPENVAGTLSDCAALASKKILEQLAKALQAQNDEKVALSSAVEQLEAVEELSPKNGAKHPPDRIKPNRPPNHNWKLLSSLSAHALNGSERFRA